jgi:ankyrin repeat protein
VARAAGNEAGQVTPLDIINTLLAANVDVNPQLNMHRPSRGGNSGRFIENLRSTGATPLSRAVEGGDVEVARLLLAKGANPNISDMGLTPFLLAAGVGPGSRGGTGLAAQGAAGGAANTALMDLLLEHGADINAQITGTKTYSMRVSRAPSSNESLSALHVAAQTGRADLVKYLLEKGANPSIVDAEGRKPIDLLPGAPVFAASGSASAAAERPGAGAPRNAPAGGAANTAAAAEIRTLLENAASKK